MKAQIFGAMLLVASVMLISIQSQTHGNLKIAITGLRNSNGEIDLHLFNSANGFAKEETKSIKHVRGKINNYVCLITIENLPFGKYAFIVYHDENNDRQMNKAWYGKPIEGVATSNNAKGRITGPPSFDEAKFDFDSKANILVIKIKYL